MKPLYFLFVLYFLLVPNQYIPNCSPKGVLCDYAPSLDPRQRPDKQMSDNYMSTSYYQKTFEDQDVQDEDQPRTVKIHYEPPIEEKCLNDREVKYKSEECTGPEAEAVKLSGSRCTFDKPTKRNKPSEKIIKLDFAKEEVKCCTPVKKEKILCAECEQCELQVKANGEGVLLKCKDCREVSSDEVVFLSQNNRKIIRLP